jgi:hypothetical protein
VLRSVGEKKIKKKHSPPKTNQTLHHTTKNAKRV